MATAIGEVMAQRGFDANDADIASLVQNLSSAFSPQIKSVYGTYTGDSTQMRTIPLEVNPFFVIIVSAQAWIKTSSMSFAFSESIRLLARPLFTVVANGFIVSTSDSTNSGSLSYSSNDISREYQYTALYITKEV